MHGTQQLAHLTSSLLWFLALLGAATTLYALFGRHVIALNGDLRDLRSLSGSRMQAIQPSPRARRRSPPRAATPTTHAAPTFAGVPTSLLRGAALPDPVRSGEAPHRADDDACDLRVAEVDLEHAAFCLNGAEPLVAPKNHWWGSEFDAEYLH